ncbi:MAG: hypothetical protein ACO3ND_00310 [Opitutales bacterium]
MPDAVANPWRLRAGWALFFGLLLLVVLAQAWRADGRALHADESVQWDLARRAAEGEAYGRSDDKFHGPALSVVVRAAAVLTGTDFGEMSPGFLRSVPHAFLVLLSFAPLALTGAGLRERMLAALTCLLVGGALPYARYFVQETLLVCAVGWSCVLWMRAEASGWRRPPLALCGVAAGFALACKVTAAAQLGFLVASVLLLRRQGPGWRGLLLLGLSATLSWIFFQTSCLSDPGGLMAWGAQFLRSFGVATGGEDALEAPTLVPWLWCAGWLGLLTWLRWRVRPVAGLMGRHPGDPALLASWCIFLLHLALPYKTPWLLLAPLLLPLAALGPAMISGRFAFPAVTAFGFVLPFLVADNWRVVWSHTPTLTSQVAALEAGAASQARVRGGNYFIAVSGGHYWPLPYYLRRHPVGYGDFPEAARAPLRLIPAEDASRPVVPGYVTGRLQIREGEAFWVLVAKGDERHFSGLLR